jgi:ribose transport system permease protein
VVVLAVIASGMIFVGIAPALQKSVQGAVVLLVVVGATWRLRRRVRSVK